MNFVNCPNTTGCIHREWFCDGENDCWDMSDEQNCTTSGKRLCKLNQFQCLDGSCIKMDAHCDGHNDCHDERNDAVSSDERNCSK